MAQQFAFIHTARMSFQICFWILMLLWLIYGVRTNRTQPQAVWVPDLLLFLLILLLGWHDYGAPLHN